MDIPPSPERPRDSTQVALLLDVVRTQVDEAFRIAEVLEAKAKSLLQASTIFFGASQAAVGIQVAARGAESTPTWSALTATVIGVVGLIALALTAVNAVAMQEPEDRLAIDVDTLSKRLIDFAERDDPRVSRFMLGELAAIVNDRRETNRAKVTALRCVRVWAYLALGASTLQLLFGMVTAYAFR